MKYADIEEIMASEPGSTYWDEYVWGQVIDRHLFGDYCILQYTCNRDNVTRYHPYFYGVEKNGKILPGVGKKARWIDFNHSYNTLDEAVLGAGSHALAGLAKAMYASTG